MPSQDLTPLFNSILQSEWTRLHSPPLSTPSSPSTRRPPSLLHPDRKLTSSQDPFTKEAYRIAQFIQTLRTFLRSIRGPYIRGSSSNFTSLPSLPARSRPAPAVEVPVLSFDVGGPQNGRTKTVAVSEVSARQRDELDAQIAAFFRGCLDMVRSLSAVVSAGDTFDANPLFDHRTSMIWYLENGLMQATQAQREMQEERDKRGRQWREMFEPQIYDSSVVKPIRHAPISPRPMSPTSLSASPSAGTARNGWDVSDTLPGHLDASERDFSKLFDSHARSERDRGDNVLRNRKHAAEPGSFSTPSHEAPPSFPTTSQFPSPGFPPGLDSDPFDDSDTDITESLTSAELQQLADENAVLLADLEGRTEEVVRIAQNVHEIAQMQAELGRLLVGQDDTVTQIHLDTGATVDALTRANEYLRNASMTGSDMRMMVILFFLVMAFTVVFLDWYG
ncbi:hypothetical protein M427DRAFT_61853 [Gonapodya prolifera JEL478]|uniref:t-SNARE coiled-coil homology domain-containing protein n=1 Tax=Gonapodya prolifera (strain JEL478) TaxID=1344416 RepID=A0A139A1I8_GONPJ|nr:hypothetical protein M427DRAFT_61853 [Gonapodya prolifera JEL478]|eukprot:KXS10646.1 hypothetical protein M427DRAFT_61853 [Gonapodya prolifera JEL478]